MVYKRFGFVVTWLVFLLVATIFAFNWTLSQGNLKVTSFNLLVIVIFETWYLLYYIKRTNRDLARFFVSFRNKDSSINFGEKPMGKAFQELYKGMNSVIQEYSNLQQEREAQFSFFVNAFQQIPTGILVYNSEGAVKLQNKALLQLLKIGNFLDIKSLESFRPGFSKFIHELKPGQGDVIKVRQGESIVNISLKVTEFVVRNESLRLIIFHDVTSELEHGEIESMQKMVRVLTHEIMNSVSPITLASASLIRQYKETPYNESESTDQKEVFQENMSALNAIHKRSKGLTNFVENYRQLTRLPHPVFETIEVKQLIENLEALLKDQILERHISFNKEIVPDNLSFLADEKLIEQVLINLVKNSVEALETCINPYIRLTAIKFGEKILIQIEDNGKGIQPEIADQIFTPMFTTKPNGTGIGLSLSRQIMHMHRGSIQVNSEPGVKTVFTLRF